MIVLFETVKEQADSIVAGIGFDDRLLRDRSRLDEFHPVTILFELLFGYRSEFGNQGNRVTSADYS